MTDLGQRAQAVFNRFSPFIRDYIYRNGWNELRRVQIEAADCIFNSESNLLITSDTASGKTEAALFPLLSMMEEESPEYFQILYVSPLKSLINDQYERMDVLLQESYIPVFRWHGDVNQNKKENFLKNPRGLLQITPESLESLLCRRRNDISRIFAHLKYVIIDEFHALTGSDRGNQIICQLQRISRLIGFEPRRIALSATIGNPTAASQWLAGGATRSTQVIQIPSENASWKLALEHFDANEPSPIKGIDPATALIYRATKNDKCVVFSNSREETEGICAALRSVAKTLGEDDRFYIHHGNLSAAIREEAEAVLKNNEKNVTACATATLELGIDIGKLRRIINREAPNSVSTFLQRIGRSGRRGLPPEMLMVFQSEDDLSEVPLPQRLPWSLLQGIAVVELYRKEKWIEPCGEKPLPASLLFHQSLSILASAGSLSPSALAKEVLTLAPFSNFSREDYKLLLTHMLKNDFLQLTDEKELICGPKGERLIHHFKFFAVFKDSDDFLVRCGTEEIGTIHSAPPVGEHFALAGRVWQVDEIDVAKRLIYCKRVEGKMKIYWPGDGTNIHTRVLDTMHKILLTNEEFPYLLPGASKKLNEARNLAKNMGLKNNSLLYLGGENYVLFPWLGSKAFQTLKRLLKSISHRFRIRDVQSAGCYFITFKSSELSPNLLFEAILKELYSSNFSLEQLIHSTEYPSADKYDWCLPREILVRSYAENHLNKEETLKQIQTVLNHF